MSTNKSPLLQQQTLTNNEGDFGVSDYSATVSVVPDSRLPGSRKPNMLSLGNSTTPLSPIMGDGSNPNLDRPSTPPPMEKSEKSIKSKDKHEVVMDICPFLEEQSACVKIQSVQAEIEEYREMGILQKPVEIYLKHCQKYSASYAKTTEIFIGDYKFSSKDMQNKVISTKVFEILSLQEADFGAMQMTDQEIASQFKTEHMKIFSDILYHNHSKKHVLMVKTWQKISFNCKLQSSSVSVSLAQLLQKRKTTQGGGSALGNSKDLATSIMNMTQKSVAKDETHLQDGLSKTESIQFYIKTIQFFDDQCKKLNEPILVEQIFGNFEDVRVYDTTVLQFQEKVYYFKRIFSEPMGLHPKNDEDDFMKSTKRDGADTTLQLFTYNLCTNKEEQMVNFFLDEYEDELERARLQIDTKHLMTEPEDGNRITYLLQQLRYNLPVQFNVQFSKPFGPSIIDNSTTHMDFLKNQFLSFQEYVKGKEFKPIQIFSMKTMVSESMVSYSQSEDSEQDLEIVDTGKMEDLYKGNNEVNRQVQFLNHMLVDEKLMIFIIQNIYSQVEIQYNVELAKTTSVCYYPRQQSDLYHKINNNNCGVQVQCVQINKATAKVGEKKISQYFFVDSNNKIQILYPNYHQKAERVKTMEEISFLSNIKKMSQPQNYKKITYVDIDTQRSEKQRNVSQQNDHLQKILATDKVKQNQTYTFVRDENKQQLYIQEPACRQIIRKILKEHECEVCGNPKDNVQFIADVKSPYPTEKDDVSRKSEVQDNDKAMLYEESQQYLQYQINPQTNQFHDNQRRLANTQQFYMAQEKIIVRIPDNEIKNNVFIDDFEGNKVKVRIYSPGPHMPDEQKIDLEFYQACELYSIFIFGIMNQKKFTEVNEGNKETESLVTRKSYVFIRKTREEVIQIFKSQGQIDIIEPGYRVDILTSYDKLENIPFKDIRELQFITGAPKLDKAAKNDHDGFREIKLSLPRYYEPCAQTMINYVPILYQEKQDDDDNKLIIFDINDNTFKSDIPNITSRESQKYMYENDEQYNVFSICRTSDIYNDTTKNSKGNSIKRQRAKYQLFTMFSEKLARIKVDECIISYTKEQITVQSIGMKNIMLSKKIVQMYDWSFIKNSCVLPYLHPQTGIIKGCQFVLQISSKEYVKINMMDQIVNNLHKYQSNVCQIGSKKFQISTDDKELYVMVISSIMRRKFIELNIFDSCEVYKVMRQLHVIYLGMRTPDLEFLVLNDFQDVQRSDFFRCQEILLGKSIMDICLPDAESVREALKTFNQDSENHKGSIIEMLTKGDQVRRDVFKEIKLYPVQQLLFLDLNFRGTIERSKECNSFKALQMLINFFFEYVNTQDYYPIIMHDLTILLEQKQIDINDFFEVSYAEKKMSKSLFCNIENSFNYDTMLPVFSDQIVEYQLINQFYSFHNKEQEIADQINANDAAKAPGIVKNYETEHRYIDFTNAIIGDKIKQLEDIHGLEDVQKFDDIYIARYMLKCVESNDEFYLKESVQKIIDFQWITTFKVLNIQFNIYLLMYLIPVCITMFTEDQWTHDVLLKTALFPAIMLFLIETVQMREQGIEYFMGWNLIDFMQFFSFISLQYFTAMEDGKQPILFMPELKFVLIILAFMKLTFFVRIFESYGFLVQMIFYCIGDLVPFIMSYLMFIYFFAIIGICLNMEIDPEGVESVAYLNFFQKMLLQTFCNSVGQIGLPTYTKIIESSVPRGFRNLNIFLIWFMWYMQTFFMLIIMLNFMIAVISNTYERVQSYQKIISFKHKAELNEETFMLIRTFMDLQEYKIIVFSTSKESSKMSENMVQDGLAKLRKKFVALQKDLNTDHTTVKDSMQILEENQRKIESTMRQRFEQITNAQSDMRKDILHRIDTVQIAMGIITPQTGCHNNQNNETEVQ